MTNKLFSTKTMNKRLVIVIAAGMLLAVSAAWAQATSFSNFTFQLSGTVLGGSENLTCSGPVNVSAMVVKDPSMPTNAIVTIDTSELSCTGATTGASYSNTGHAELTRLLAGSDQVQAALALIPDVPQGHMHARPAVATLNLTFDMAAGALTGASGTIAAQ
jgi:hypothetical protein